MTVIEISREEMYQKINEDFNREMKKVCDNMKKCKTWEELEHYRNRYLISFYI